MSKAKKNQTPAQQDKIERVMSEFKDGKLKDSAGNVVTSKEQAIAIALSEAGISRKGLQKTELLNKVRVAKDKVKALLVKEQVKNEFVKMKLTKLIKQSELTEEKVKEFAEKNGMQPSEVHTIMYNLLHGYMSGGIAETGGKE